MPQFIIGVREHNLFNYTVSAYWVEKVGESYYKVIQNILSQDIKAAPEKFTENQEAIVRLTEEISDNSIYKKFLTDRNISLTEFYKRLDPKFVEQEILPFIGERIAKIFKLAYYDNIKIFFKPYRYEKIYVDDELFYLFEPTEPVFYFEKTENELKYSLKLFYKGQYLNLRNYPDIKFIVMDPCHFVIDRRIYHIDDLNCKKLKPFLEKDTITIRSKIDEYLSKFVKQTVLKYRVVAKGFDIEYITPKKRAVLTLDYTPLKKWGFILRFHYDEFVFPPISMEATVIGNREKEKELTKYVKLEKNGQTYKFITFNRDLSWEENIIYALKKAGLRTLGSNEFFVYPESENIKSPDLQLQTLINWLNKNADLFDHLQIEVIQKTDKQYFTKAINLNFKVEKKIDWFDIYATVKFGEFEIPFIELKDYILNGIREFKLPNGQIAIIPEEWFAKYKKIFLFAKKERNKKKIKLTKAHFTLLENIETEQVDRNIKQELEKLKELFEQKVWQIPKIPSTIKATLRNYQKQGYAWLYYLHKYSFGGCLADDMGLGKTLQVITTISKVLEERKQKVETQQTENQLPTLFPNGHTYPSLIVVPKSLIHNWVNEFRKFAPNLSVLVYAGTNRVKLRDRVPYHDIVLTSYGVVRNDIDFLSKFNFLYIVLDESQYIKNPYSKIYEAVKKLKGENRVILTGTPIENSLSDLWTQMNFLNPGLLGSHHFFKQYFITPIEKLGREDIKEELRKIISPFLLRRTKEEVIKDLPELNEQIIYCEMSDEQRLIYESEKSKIRNEILKIYESGKLKETSIYVLRALTRLRQIANHPAIVDNSKKYTSGKFEIVSQKIETVIQEGHKLLIFSSFVKHLEIYQKFLEAKGYKYAMLTGESENREEIIKYFQNNENVKVFLISLKAGGVGLNLTAADYVFILDPWWNPAAEQQAISRAHRIGQDKKVFVYRFITVNSVEEKILQLQKKKKELFKEFVDSANFFAQLSEKNIVELFE